MNNKNWIQLMTHPIIQILAVIIIAFICMLFNGKTVQGSHQFDGLFSIIKFTFFVIVILGVYLITFLVTKKFYSGIILSGIVLMILYTIFDN
jgi:hypothetical protein